MQIARLILPLMLLIVAGCASRPKVDPNTNWSNRIGTYSYDQALAELGKPDVIAESSAGRTAEWILKRSPQLSFGLGVGQGVYGSHSGVGFGAGTSISPRPRGEYLRLTFDPAGKLAAWERVRY